MIKDAYANLAELGLELPEPPPRGGLYSPIRTFGRNLAWCSGVGPTRVDGPAITGAVGADLTIEEAQAAAKLAMLNILSIIERETGDLNSIRFVKLLGFVRSSDDFEQQPAVMNGASQLLLDVFGEVDGLPSRSAIGVNQLPGGICVEIEAVYERRDEVEL
ncbi:MAG: RidA family protein [Bacillota bacterium]|nr:RidA family protein [Bacillota bacterium]